MPECREQREIKQLLKDHGAELERTKKHKVYRFPSGRIWVTSSSPRSDKAWKNNLSELREALGLNGERGAVGERRPKKVKAERQKLSIATTPVPTWPDLVAKLSNLRFERKCIECGWRMESNSPATMQLCPMCRIFLEIYVVDGVPKVGAAWKYVAPLRQQFDFLIEETRWSSN